MDAWVNSKMGPPGGNTKRQSFEGSAKCSNEMIGIQRQAQIESEKGNRSEGLVVHGNTRFCETQNSFLYLYRFKAQKNVTHFQVGLGCH
jgi:hypothetical protein